MSASGPFVAVDDNDMPIAVIDLDQFRDEARELAFQLISATHTEGEEITATRLIADRIMHGDGTAGIRLLFAANVLDSVLQDVVGPLLAIAEHFDPDVLAVLQGGGE